MHRKVQVFSKPGKVSIGQDRNKKDPHRGRKLLCFYKLGKLLLEIEIKKIPIGDGNLLILVSMKTGKLIEIKKIPIGDGN